MFPSMHSLFLLLLKECCQQKLLRGDEPQRGKRPHLWPEESRCGELIASMENCGQSIFHLPR